MFVHRQYDKPPVVVKVDASNPFIDEFSWEWDEKTRSYNPVLVGKRNIKDEIQAAKGETLTEIMARQPGNSPVEKLANAVNKGILELRDEGDNVVDETELPQDYLEAFNMMQKGYEAYKSLGLEKKDGSPYENAVEYYKAKLAEAEAEAAKKEEVKQDAAQ